MSNAAVKCAWREVAKLWAKELEKRSPPLTKGGGGGYSRAAGGGGEMERFEEGGEEVYRM